MNVTKDRFKNRQLHTEDYLQIVSAEQRGYAEVFAYQRIAENNDIITDFWTNNLLELILRKDNLNKAYLKVKSNKGAGGIDGMQVDELLPFLRENQAELIQKIREGKYKPTPVRRVEIPKEEKGKVRKLGIPTVVDRIIQQAIAQELTPIFKSKKSANRVKESIVKYIEGKLFLKVNQPKTKIAHVSKIKYLGYTFYRYKGKCRFRVHQKSINKMKDKLRELTNRNNGWSNPKREQKLKEFIMGWVNYFSLADMKNLMKITDEWLRRRIRAIYWKQWKKVKTKYRMLKALKLEDWRARELACCRKGIWRAAQMLNQVFSNKIIAKLGYISMSDYYLKVCEN